jgi:hypothetical protein
MANGGWLCARPAGSLAASIVERTGPVVFSEPARWFSDALTREVERLDLTVTLVATRGGVVNSLRLTSPLRVLEGIFFRSSDSLLPPVVVPLAHDLTVRGGDAVGRPRAVSS